MNNLFDNSYTICYIRVWRKENDGNDHTPLATASIRAVPSMDLRGRRVLPHLSSWDREYPGDPQERDPRGQLTSASEHRIGSTRRLTK